MRLFCLELASATDMVCTARSLRPWVLQPAVALSANAWSRCISLEKKIPRFRIPLVASRFCLQVRITAQCGLYYKRAKLQTTRERHHLVAMRLVGCRPRPRKSAILRVLLRHLCNDETTSANKTLQRQQSSLGCCMTSIANNDDSAQISRTESRGQANPKL